ncbi:MAG: hypothetical protein JNJ57_02340 [Saprospiraceae bacterium]|nr:hypothetical protein [Saprospiraceae bacterium]
MNRQLFTLFSGFMVLLMVTSCESAQDKLLRSEQELLSLINQKDYFQVKVGKQELKWPLPPISDQTNTQASRLESLTQTVKSIDKTALAPTDASKLDRLTGALAQMSKNGFIPGFDPLECVVSEQLTNRLKQSSQEEKILLFSSLQAYYQEVEKRWLPTSSDRSFAASSKAEKSYDLLLDMDAPEPTLLALKDFIALCRSNSFFSSPLQ